MSHSKFATILVVFLLWIIGGACLFCQESMIEEEQKTTSLNTTHHVHPEIEKNSWMPYHFNESSKSPVY